MRHSPPPQCALCAPWCNNTPTRGGARLLLCALCALCGATTPPPGARRCGTHLPLNSLCALRGAKTPPPGVRRCGTRLPLSALCALRGAKTPPPGAERASFSVLSVRSVVQQHPHWRQSAPPCRGKFQTRHTPLYSLSYLRRERMLKVLQRSCPLTNGLKWPRIIDPERFVVTPVAAPILYS